MVSARSIITLSFHRRTCLPNCYPSKGDENHHPREQLQLPYFPPQPSLLTSIYVWEFIGAQTMDD